MLHRIALVSLILCAAGARTLADPPDGIDISQILAKAAGGAAIKPGDAPALPKFEDVTKDMKSQAGLFTLWSYPPEAKDKDTEKLLCQIPTSFLGEKFMLSTSISGGGFLTGFPLD